MNPAIAIIGAGPSGLILARLLEINDIDYIVFEQNERLARTNFRATVDIEANSAQLALNEAGLIDKFKAVAKFDTQLSAIFDQHGEIITRSDIDDLPQIDWHDLKTLLVESIPDGKIRWSAGVQNIEKKSDGSSSIHLADGSVEGEFRLVVGADGMWSKVRPLVTSAEPIYYGITYLTTSISLESNFWTTVAGKLNPTTYIAIGQGKQLFARRNVAGTYTISLGLPLPVDWNDACLSDASAFRRRLVEHEFNHWAPRVLNWIRHTDGEFHKWPLYIMPTSAFSWKPVPGLALIGDAAHPTTPWPGEAIGCAMCDGLQLGQSIGKHGINGLDQAVSEYERSMFPRAIELVTKGTELGAFLFAKDAASLMEAMLAASADE